MNLIASTPVSAKTDKGVTLDFYAIHGLKASIEFEEPDTADVSVFLYSRCADYTADGNIWVVWSPMAKNIRVIVRN